MQVLSSDGFVLEQNHDYHGLDPQVVFTVPRDGTYIVRVFAFPSVTEGFGLAAMEALAAGGPVVTRDLPVLRDRTVRR